MTASVQFFKTISLGYLTGQALLSRRLNSKFLLQTPRVGAELTTSSKACQGYFGSRRQPQAAAELAVTRPAALRAKRLDPAIFLLT
jgi:hypothetical protein